jgi:hypothetical protein
MSSHPKYHDYLIIGYILKELTEHELNLIAHNIDNCDECNKRLKTYGKLLLSPPKTTFPKASPDVTLILRNADKWINDKRKTDWLWKKNEQEIHQRVAASDLTVLNQKKKKSILKMLGYWK